MGLALAQERGVITAWQPPGIEGKWCLTVPTPTIGHVHWRTSEVETFLAGVWAGLDAAHEDDDA